MERSSMNLDKLLTEVLKIRKAIVFVEHIERHLKGYHGAKVMCKICDKTIDEIYEEHMREEHE